MEQTFKKQLKQMLAETEKRFNETKELEVDKETMTNKLNELNAKEEELYTVLNETEVKLKIIKAEKKEIEEKISEIDGKLKEDRKEREKMVKEAAETHLENRKLTVICVAWAEQRTRECSKCEEEAGINREMRYVCKNNHIECTECATIGQKCSKCNENKDVRRGKDLEKDTREQILLNEVADERERLEKERLEKEFNNLRNEQLIQLMNATSRTQNTFKTTDSTFIQVNRENRKFNITEKKTDQGENAVFWNNSKVSLEEENWKLTVTIEGKRSERIQGRFYEGSEIFQERDRLYLKTNNWKCECLDNQTVSS